jgi:hypothetical protein
MNTTKTTKTTEKKGVKLTPKKATKKATPSPLTESKKNLVNLWKEETLTPKAIYKFFNSEIAQELTNKYVTEINASFKSNLSSNALNFKLLSFAYKYEVTSCKLSDDKKSIEYGEKKNHFSANFMLELLKRKAKYNTPKNEEFIKVSNERETSKLCRLITADAKAELNKRALSIGLDFINTTEK